MSRKLSLNQRVQGSSPCAPHRKNQWLRRQHRETNEGWDTPGDTIRPAERVLSHNSKPTSRSDCPRTPEMVGMLDAARLARMKRTASSSHRGGIIDEKALYHALKADRIARCRARCFAVPNFIGAPLVAGAPPGGSRRTSVAAVENIVSILDGKRSATTSSTRRCWTKRPPPSSNIIHELDRILVPRLSG